MKQENNNYNPAKLPSNQRTGWKEVLDDKVLYQKFIHGDLKTALEWRKANE